MCERAYHVMVTAAQAVPEYDRITLILTAVGIIVAALGVMFTAASLVLALGAIRGWNELLGKSNTSRSQGLSESQKLVQEGTSRSQIPQGATPGEIIRHFTQTPPANVAGIAEALGLRVLEEDLGPTVAGMIKLDPANGEASKY